MEQKKLVTWNIAGNQIELAYNQVKSHMSEVIGYAFLETWRVEEVKWRPEGGKTIYQMLATKSHKKGRASGGIIVILANSVKPRCVTRGPHWIKILVDVNKQPLWWIVTYMPPLTVLKSHLTAFEDMIEKSKNFPVLITGDINARIGIFNNRSQTLASLFNLPLFFTRQSKDTIVNTRGRWLINLMLKLNLSPLNGTSKTDRNGEFTYVATQGQSTPDLTLFSVLNPPLIEDFEIANLVMSDHFPQMITIGPLQGEKQREQNLKYKLKYTITNIEQEEVTNEVNRVLENKVQGLTDEYNVQAQILRIFKTNKLLINPTNNKKTKYIPNWWDTEVKAAFKEVNKLLQEFRNENSVNSRVKYAEARRNWTKMKKKKKEKLQAANLQKLARAANSVVFWDLINQLIREKKVTERGTIPRTTWATWYAKLFEENNPIKEIWNGVGIFDPLVENNFTILELNKVLKKLKNKTSPGSF